MEIRRAQPEDACGIQKVCIEGYRHTYPGLMSADAIEHVIEEFYNKPRILQEIQTIEDQWNGWFVAVDNGQVAGAAGGGLLDEQSAELFVLYLNPEKKRQGIGSRLLEAVTEDQMRRGAEEQWVSVTKGNAMGIPFYEARGFIFQSEAEPYSHSEANNPISLRYMRKLS